MRPSKWDLLLDQKPVPVVTHLLEEVSKLFAKDLAHWPPRVEDFDPATGAELQGLLADRTLTPPDPRLFVEAFQLTRFDLGREHEAYDDYMRNRRWQQTGLAPTEKAMVLFVSRFLSEQLLGLAEATQGRLTRPQLLDVLQRTERHYFSRGTTP